MSRRTRLLLFLCGSGLFTYLVLHIGIATLVANAMDTGWMFIPIILLYGVVYVASTGAWVLILADEPRRPSFGRLYAVTTAGAALNFVTPMVNVGGEPFRIAAIAPWVTTRRAAGSVIIHNVLRTLGIFLSWLTALLLGFVLLPHDLPVRLALTVATLVSLALTAILFSGHRRGALEKTLNVLHRVPGLGRVARWLEPKREMLVQMDQQIAQFYHRHPVRFGAALLLEYVSRAVYMGEYYLIALSIGLPIGYLKCYLIGGLVSLVQNVLFVIPFEIGSKEGSLYLLFQMLGLDPHLGVYTAIATRLRDLVWIGIGLLLVWLAGRSGTAERSRALS